MASSAPILSLHTIPQELILEIFEYLPYEDLKLHVPLVCKKFHAVLEKQSYKSATTIDKTLWRDSPRVQPPDKVPVTLHPILTDITYAYTPWLQQVRVDLGIFRLRLIDVPELGDENVSCPSASKAIYHMETHCTKDHDLHIDGTGEGGAVTVMDVMAAITRAIYDGPWRELHEDEDNRGHYWDKVAKAEIEDGVLWMYDLPA